MGPGPPEEAKHGSRPRAAVWRLPGLRRGRPAEDPHAHEGTRRQRAVQRKSAVIDDITERLRSAEASVLTEYRGLTVTDLATLRAALRPAETDYKVYKNTLARRAAADAGLTELAEWLEGRWRSCSCGPTATR